MLAHYEVKAEKYLNLLDMNDEEERKNPLPKMQRKDLEKKLRHIDERVAELREQFEKIEADGDICTFWPIIYFVKAMKQYKNAWIFHGN